MFVEGGGMRFHLPALLIPLAVAAAPAHGATRNFGVNGFDRVRIEGPYRVKLSTDVAPFATASGSATALDRISIEVQGRTLRIHVGQSSWGGYPGQDPGPVEIAVGTHDLNQASLTGSGSLDIDKVKGLAFALSVEGSGLASIGQADVDQLQISVAGTGEAVVKGTALKLSATMRGTASLDASGLSIKDANISADGAATVKANVTNSATLVGSGPATFVLTGNPACTSKVAGSASVSGCR